MASPETPAETGIEVRTYFVRERNALVARAEFGELFVDYYLHLAQYGMRHAPQPDRMLKDALAAVTLHSASRPWNETVAWTLHLREPLLNLFVTGNNPLRAVAGHLFTEGVKDTPESIFYSDVVRGTNPPRRSIVLFKGADIFRAVETLYSQSEQRPARFFQIAPEDLVMVSGQPGCDLAWLESLTDDTARELDQKETLSLLERRTYRWDCGCSQARMLEMLAPTHRGDPEALFGNEEALRIHCPRCGARHVVTREALEAYVDTRPPA